MRNANERYENTRRESVRYEAAFDERMDEITTQKFLRMMERISLGILAVITYGLMTQIAADDFIGMLFIRTIVFLLGAAFTVLVVMDVFSFVEAHFGSDEDPDDLDGYDDENEEPEWLDTVEIVDFMNYDLSNRKTKRKAASF